MHWMSVDLFSFGGCRWITRFWSSRVQGFTMWISCLQCEFWYVMTNFTASGSNYAHLASHGEAKVELGYAIQGVV